VCSPWAGQQVFLALAFRGLVGYSTIDLDPVVADTDTASNHRLRLDADNGTVTGVIVSQNGFLSIGGDARVRASSFLPDLQEA